MVSGVKKKNIITTHVILRLTTLKAVTTEATRKTWRPSQAAPVLTQNHLRHLAPSFVLFCFSLSIVSSCTQFSKHIINL